MELIKKSGTKKAFHKAGYPHKTFMNLAQRERPKEDPVKVVLLAVFLVALVFVVARFGVFDRIWEQYSLDSAARKTEGQVAAMKVDTADYDELFKEYSRYRYDAYTPADLASVDRLEAIELLDKLVLSVGNPTGGYTITGNVLSLSLSGMDLAKTAKMLESLYGDPLVSSVEVYTAQTAQERQNAVISMTITLKDRGAV